MKRIWSILAVTFFMLWVSVMPALADESNETSSILDLRNIDLQKNKVVSLAGNWDFFWKVFIDEKETDKEQHEADKIVVKTPSLWTSYKIHNSKLPGLGYGSYRLLVLLPSDRPDTMALLIPVFDTSYELFINGKSLSSNGKTGTSAETSKPAYNPQTKLFIPDSDSLSIIVHVSNFSHRRGGFWKNMYLGNEDSLQRQAYRSKFFNDYSQAILLAFALFFIIFQVLLQRERIMLYFALALIGIYIRSLCTDEYNITHILTLSWQSMIRMEYISTYLAYIFGSWYLFYLFPSPALKKVISANCIVILVMVLLVLFTPVPVFAKTMPVFQVISSLLFIFFLIRSLKGVIQKKGIDVLYFISMLVVIYGHLHDVLLSQSAVFGVNVYLMPYALTIFIFIQAGILIARWVEAFKTTERLHKENKYINENLEKLVKSRTLELEQKNSELEASISLKNRLFSIIAHDLKSPVIALQQLTDLMSSEKDIRKQDSIITTVKQMTTSVLLLIDNLILWGMNQDKRIKSNSEKVPVNIIVLSVFDVLKENASWKEISLKNLVEPDAIAYCDQHLFEISLRNVISNSLKFTDNGGWISISSQTSADNIDIIIEDNGTGMQEDQIRNILEGQSVSSLPGTSMEKGTGLGLSLVRDLMILNRGGLKITSTPGKGTIVILTFPLPNKTISPSA